MHDTLVPNIKAYVDKIVKNNDTNEMTYTGWCFHIIYNLLPLRVKSETQGQCINVDAYDILSVGHFYNKYGNTILKCGWTVNIPNMITDEIYYLEMNIQDQWVKVIELTANINNIEIKKQQQIYNSKITQINSDRIPSFVVVDNFYKNPLAVRDFALSLNFEANIKDHKGKRCLNPEFRFAGLKERFERILDTKIKNWDYYPTNGCFQYCIAEDKSVYHCDGQEYAGIIFLTPDAPPESGTQLFRSKYTKKMKVSDAEFNIVFKNGFYDSTEFERVDVVGNLFNRLILFDAKTIHAAPTYFGTTLENSRLFQLFFFDIDT
jgi:hypothetical protein